MGNLLILSSEELFYFLLLFYFEKNHKDSKCIICLFWCCNEIFFPRQSDEQPSDEHAQRQWIIDATSKDRAVCGASQRRGGGRHGHWPAMMVTEGESSDACPHIIDCIL